MKGEKTFLRRLRQHRGILYKVAGMYTDRTEDRRDLEQEIVYQLWRAYPGFRADSSFSTWMYRVALNTALGRFRARQPLLSFTGQLPERPAPGDASPQSEKLLAAIRRLPRADRAVIALYLEDLSLAEIGDILGITANHAGVKLHRAKRKLKNLVNPEP